MKSGEKKWSTVVDYFLILGAIVGVGFASGKEICVFFFDFQKFSFFGLLSFCLLYLYLFFVVGHIKVKLKLDSYSELNKFIFGKFSKLSNIVLIINFTIASAGMLAGADYIFLNNFNVGFRIPTLILSLLTLFVLIGGISKIKIVSNFLVPIMLITIIINSIANINPTNIQFTIVKSNVWLAIFYGLLFGVNNFLTSLPILVESNTKTKTKLFIILTLSLIILLSILMFASSNFNSQMPMLELSKNLGSSFYSVYFITLIIALFSTLMISSYNVYQIVASGKNMFVAILIVFINIIVSNFGYEFVIKNLYFVSGILSGVFIFLFVFLSLFKILKNKYINKKYKK